MTNRIKPAAGGALPWLAATRALIGAEAPHGNSLRCSYWMSRRRVELNAAARHLALVTWTRLSARMGYGSRRARALGPLATRRRRRRVRRVGGAVVGGGRVGGRPGTGPPVP